MFLAGCFGKAHVGFVLQVSTVEITDSRQVHSLARSLANGARLQHCAFHRAASIIYYTTKVTEDLPRIAQSARNQNAQECGFLLALSF